MPVAFISTRTSPAFGPSRSTSTISSGFLASNATAARVFIVNSTLALQIAARTHQDGHLACSAPSFASHAGLLCLGVCIGFVFLLCRTDAPDGVMRAGTQIHIKIVHVAGDIRIVAEGWHDGVTVLAAARDDPDEIAVTHRLQRILQRRRVGRSHSVRAMADMAFGVVATVSGIGVPIDRPVGRNLEGRGAFLVEIFAILGLDGGRIVRSAGKRSRRHKHESGCNQPDNTQELILEFGLDQPARGTSHAPDEVVLLYCGSANTVSAPPSAV